MSELHSLTALEMRQGLLQRDFTAQELAQAHLQRIAQTNKVFNSFLTVPEEQVLQSAKAADALLGKQREKSPLLTGIPVAVKDNLVTKGVATTCASKILQGFIPPYDGTAVSKLAAAGSVMIGKTNMDEFGMGSSNENSAYGPVKNPFDLERVPGGTSGGSAVAVGLGQAPLALGTDTGGSIRQPASLTGVIGLKPTYGRVSRYGVVAYASSLDQVGPFARTVTDLAAVLNTIAGHDELDSTSMRVPVPDYLAEVKQIGANGIKGLRIGVPAEYFIAGIDPEVERAVKAAIDRLSKLGAEIVNISLPHTEHALAVYYILAPAEASSNLARYDGVRYGCRAKNVRSLTELYERTRAEGFGAEVQRRILIGTYVLSAGYYDAYYLKAQQVRTLILDDFKAAFANKCDVIAAPVSPTTAFKLGEKTESPLQMYLADVFTIPISLAGLPAMSIPIGMDAKNLPIGLQLIGPAFEELRLLKTAQLYLEQHPFDTRSMTKAHG